MPASHPSPPLPASTVAYSSPSTAPRPAPPPGSPQRRIIVVGAGVSGLTCAHHLLASPLNLQVIVLEGRHRIGGRVFTHWFDATDPEANAVPSPASDPAASAAAAASVALPSAFMHHNAASNGDPVVASLPTSFQQATPTFPTAYAHLNSMPTPTFPQTNASLADHSAPAPYAPAFASPALVQHPHQQHQPYQAHPYGGAPLPHDPLSNPYHQPSLHPAHQQPPYAHVQPPPPQNAFPYPAPIIDATLPSVSVTNALPNGANVHANLAIAHAKQPTFITAAMTTQQHHRNEQPRQQLQPPYRHPFHDLVRGIVHPVRTYASGTPRLAIDIGASIMHGCGDDNQLVFQRAIEDRIRAPIVAGGSFYESTEHALWFDHATGNRIRFDTVVEVHHIFFMASRYMASVALQNDDGAADMESVFNCGVEYVCKQLGRTLEPLEQMLIRKIVSRSAGYCAPMRDMALMQASAGMELASVDAIIGVPYEEDDPPFPGEVPNMASGSIKQQATRLEKTVVTSQKPARHTVASRRGGPGDRIVLDGYTPFLVDKLSVGVDIRLGKSVCAIAKGVRAPKAGGLSVDGAGMAGVLGGGASAVLKCEGGDEGATGATLGWDDDPEVATSTVLVSTRSGEMFDADVVVVTVPLGVLKGNNEESCITFSPELSEAKMEAVRGMGMGVHNKVVLRFCEGDVFWPPDIPQLNCSDERFQMFNLHCYGKPGVLLVHVFAQSGFARGFWDMCDEGVVYEVLTTLGGMFCGGIGGERALAGKRRLARTLRICEDCRKNVDEGARTCRHCGYVLVDVGGIAEAAVGEVRMDGPFVLGRRKTEWESLPLPEEYVVTRWDEDSFALGSYSYMPCGSNWMMIEDLAAAEPRDCAHPYLFFAGEHCSDLGWQCVHGAYETGVRAARDIITCFGGNADMEGDLGAATGTYEANAGGIETDSGAGLELNGGAAPLQNVVDGMDVAEGGKAKQELGLVIDKEGEASVDNRLGMMGVGDESGVGGLGVGMSMGVGVGGRERGGTMGRDLFWTLERERALTRALIGYADVYGNINDVVDEIAYALQTFKKEPTEMDRSEVQDLVKKRTAERSEEGDVTARAFLKFHNDGVEEVFGRSFEDIAKRPRMVGLNGNKLKEFYSEDIVAEMKRYAGAVAENQISYRETLRKIAVMIYRKDGGLMTKRCLSEYLRTQEFGSGPQKELFLEKYLEKK